MFTLTQEAQGQGNIVTARASGTLTHEDYQHFTEELERRMRVYGSVRVLLDLEDFHGWDFGAAWSDFTFGLRHIGRFERCAVVGDKKWEEWLTDLGKPFFKVRYFDRSQRAQALEWLRAPEAETESSNWLGRLGDFAARHPIACVAGGVALGFLLAGALGARRLPVR